MSIFYLRLKTTGLILANAIFSSDLGEQLIILKLKQSTLKIEYLEGLKKKVLNPIFQYYLSILLRFKFQSFSRGNPRFYSVTCMHIVKSKVWKVLTQGAAGGEESFRRI